MGISNLERATQIHEIIIDKNNRDEQYELIVNLKTLANNYGLSSEPGKGITTAERALDLQIRFFQNSFNNEILDTL
jgi:hypothetical protein